MKDRVALYPNRRLITPIDGSAPYYADITRADEPTEIGTALNKANLLADDTAALMGLDSDATVNNALAALADSNTLGGTVYNETSASATVRTVTIEDVESWDDLLNTTIYIKAGLSGTLAASTLEINGLGAKPLYFPSTSAHTLTTTPPSYYWVHTGGIYGVVWDGTYLQVINPNYIAGSTSAMGIVQTSYSYTSSSTATVPTSYALYQLYSAVPTVASGSFTPVCGSTTGIGYYRKIGSVVTIAASITFSSATQVTSYITGLPYVSVACDQAIASRKAYSTAVTSNAGIGFYIPASSSQINYSGMDGGSVNSVFFGGSYISAS